MEKKAANDAAKSSKKKAELESKEASKWTDGSRDTSAKALEEQRRLEALQKKAERQRLLEEEEASIPSAAKKSTNGRQKTGSGAIDAFLNERSVDSYAASGVENALDLLSLAAKGSGAANTDKADRHPERRMKSAYAEFEEREMPILKQENPGLRLSQLKQMLQKKWKKSEENPMNQQSVAYNATRTEEREVVAKARESALDSFKS